MPSSKKQRAKQRKASAATSRSKSEVFSRLPLDFRQYNKIFKTLPPNVVVEQISKGNRFPVLGVFYLDPSEPSHRVYQQRLINAGLVQVVTTLLNRCVDESLHDIQREIGDPILWMNLYLPSILDDIIIEVPSQALVIASSIGPFCSCMSDFNKREMFKSNTLWRISFDKFFHLIKRLLLNDETVEVLLQFEGLLDLFVQCIFWKSNRPDILQELENTKKVVRFALESITAIVSFITSGKGTRLKKRHIGEMGRMNITDGEQKVPFVLALVEFLKSEDCDELYVREKAWAIFSEFIGVGCYNNKVIKGVVDFGLSFVSESKHSHFTCEDAFCVCVNIHNMFLFEGKIKERHIAIAVGAGLFEMILRLIVRYADQNDTGNLKLVAIIKLIVEAVHSAAFQRKTSDAIRDHYEKNLESLQHAERSPCVFYNNEFRDIVKAIRSILEINAGCYQQDNMLICCSCLTDLKGDEIERCSKCMKVCYCSRQCQASHWKEHKVFCKQVARSSLLHKNVSIDDQILFRAARKVFQDNFLNALLQSALKGYVILDCIVIIDLSGTTPIMDVELQSDFAMALPMSEEDMNSLRQILEKLHSGGELNIALQSSTRSILHSFPGPWTEFEIALNQSLSELWKSFKQKPKAKELALELLRGNLLTGSSGVEPVNNYSFEKQILWLAEMVDSDIGKGSGSDDDKSKGVSGVLFSLGILADKFHRLEVLMKSNDP